MQWTENEVLPINSTGLLMTSVLTEHIYYLLMKPEMTLNSIQRPKIKPEICLIRGIIKML